MNDLPGAIAVVLGGSRAQASVAPDRDCASAANGSANEKRLIESAGLAGVQRTFDRVPAAQDLIDWINAVADPLATSATETSPWTNAGRHS